jgi:hypothetical protein
VIPKKNNTFWETSFKKMYSNYVFCVEENTEFYKLKRRYDEYEHLANISNKMIIKNSNSLTNTKTNHIWKAEHTAMFPFILIFVRSPCKKKNVACYAHLAGNYSKFVNSK